MAKKCTVGPCGRDLYAKGYCRSHYERFRYGGDMSTPIRPSSAAERFMAKVKKTDSCWEWTAGKNAGGYACFKSGAGKTTLAHRFAYEYHVGPIPPGGEIDHTCGVRHCVNPRHLRVTDRAANTQNRFGARRGSKSGIRGVHYAKDRGRWVAAATLNGERVYLGAFNDAESAGAVISAWRREHMPYSVMDQRKENA